MEETKITAKLPSLDVEITRRELPEENAETITLRMTAVPSFDAVFDGLMKPGMLPLAPLTANLAMNPWLSVWSTPMLAWSHWAKVAWAPWLQSMSPLVTFKRQDDNESPEE